MSDFYNDKNFVENLKKNSKLLGFKDEHRQLLAELNNEYDPRDEVATSSLIVKTIRELEEKLNTQTLTGDDLKGLFFQSKKSDFIKALLKIFKEVSLLTFEHQIQKENNSAISPFDIFLIMYALKTVKKNRNEIFKITEEDEDLDIENIFDKANNEMANCFSDGNGMQFQYFANKLGKENISYLQKKDLELENFFYL